MSLDLRLNNLMLTCMPHATTLCTHAFLFLGRSIHIYIGDWALDKTAESMWEMSSYHDNQNSDSVLAKSFQPRPLLLQGQIVHHETNFILLVMHCAYSD